MDRTLRLELIGPTVRYGPFISPEDRAIVCGWRRETEAPGIIWFRLLTIKWRWPPIKIITCFTDCDD